MKITHLNVPIPSLTMLLESEFRNTRFNVVISELPNNKGINLGKVRLKSTKEYCGNHAKACERPGKKDKKGNWLEGADWVEFNDFLNFILDREVISANVASARGAGCIIRKGKQRRIKYDADTFVGAEGDGEWRWNYDAPPEHFRDCHQNPLTVAEFPEGTPGIYSRTGYNVIG